MQGKFLFIMVLNPNSTILEGKSTWDDVSTTLFGKIFGQYSEVFGTTSESFGRLRIRSCRFRISRFRLKNKLAGIVREVLVFSRYATTSPVTLFTIKNDGELRVFTHELYALNGNSPKIDHGSTACK